MRILIFDPRIIGHHLEYLRYLVQYTIQKGHYQLYLAVHPRIEEHAPDLVDLAQQHTEQVVLLPLTPEEYGATEDPTIIWRALAGWRAAAQRAEAVEADHCVFMELNFFQPALGLPRARAASFKVSGILFFPYCRIESQQGKWSDRFKSQMERFRKHLQLRWVLSNSQVENVFVLNDPTAAAELNDWHDTTRFKSLLDPVVNSVAAGEKVENQDEHFLPTSGDRMHFLLFGSLREQKGVRQVLEAAAQLREEEAEHVSLHLLGKARADLRNDLPRLIRRLRSSQPDLYVQYEDRYLAYQELEAALNECDVVLAPYQRTEGSSGVIGHAAKHERPVLGPQTGLIGELIREYELGITVAASDPEAIAAGMRHYLNGGVRIETIGMRQYVKERTPEQFARTLLKTIDSSQ